VVVSWFDLSELSHPSGFEAFIPGRVLLFKDLEWSLTLGVIQVIQKTEVLLGGMVSYQLLLELSHSHRAFMLETSYELVVITVEKIHTGLDEVRLIE
jgi:hypothetical protein